MPDGPAVRAGAAAQVFVPDPAAPVLSDTDRHHLSRVLRLRPGEPVVAADGRGTWRLCRFADGDLELDGPVEVEPAPRPALTVAFAPVKGDRPEWVVQKLTELGIDRIVPLETERSIVRWSGERRHHAIERLRRVAVEAAAQCRRVWLPEVAGVCTLEDLEQPAGGLALAEPGGPPLAPATRCVAVGPEGGWTHAELARGHPTVGLGPTVLRAETAALAVAALLTSRRAGTVCHGDHER